MTLRRFPMAPPAAATFVRPSLALLLVVDALPVSHVHLGWCAGQGMAHFARGMCRVCFEQFLKVSGGYRAGANPPAFTRGIQRELAAAARVRYPSLTGSAD